MDRNSLTMMQEKSVRGRVLERIARETAREFAGILKTSPESDRPSEICIFGPELTDCRTCQDYLITMLSQHGIRGQRTKISDSPNGSYSVNIEHYYEKYFAEELAKFPLL